MVLCEPDGSDDCSFALNETRGWSLRLTFHWQPWSRQGKDGRLVVFHDKNEHRYK